MKHSSSNAQRRTPNVQRSTAEILVILHKWGIHTLGQLGALDKEELRNRLGTDAVRLWEEANGTVTRLLKFIQPPESFEESFEFEYQIENTEPLLFMLRRFLEQLALRLRAIYLVAKELILRITFEDPPQDGSAAVDKQIYERVFNIPQPTNDVDLLFRMLHTHLENFRSEHPIVAVALNAQPIRPTSQQFGLFETTLRNPEQLYETLARLSALFGGDRVGTPALEETHRPDAFRMEPFSWKVRAIDLNRPKNIKTTFRIAMRRFRPAASACVFASPNWHLQSEKIDGKIIDQRGPYFLSGNWWNKKSWARNEWDLQLEHGELIRAHESDGVWKVDGIYD